MTAKKNNENPVVDDAPEAAPPDPMAGIKAGLVPVVETNIKSIKDLDDRLARTAGTIAAKIKAATDETVAEAPDHDITDDSIIVWSNVRSYIDRMATLHPVTAREVVKSMLADLTDVKAALEQDIEGIVKGKLKATSSASDAMTAMRAQRAELVTSTKAMAILIDGAEDGPTSDMIPKAPKGTGSTPSSSGPKVTSKTGRMYRVINGERKYYTKDDLSYMAFAHGVATEDLETVLRTAGITELTKPWETTLTIKGVKAPKLGKETKVTMGFEVN